MQDQVVKIALVVSLTLALDNDLAVNNRSSRLYNPIFNLVNFPNDPCIGSSTTYDHKECSCFDCEMLILGWQESATARQSVMMWLEDWLMEDVLRALESVVSSGEHFWEILSVIIQFLAMSPCSVKELLLINYNCNRIFCHIILFFLHKLNSVLYVG